ncbi:MAG: hypothetical protein LBJ36_04455 [Synergistaceae bacterium]|nr:hypothetical protein [Synergistaceae bacterium]
MSLSSDAYTNPYADPNALPEDDPDIWIGADISWYTDDVDAESYLLSTPAELYGFAYLVDRFGSDTYEAVSFIDRTIFLSNDIDLAVSVDVSIGLKIEKKFAEKVDPGERDEEKLDEKVREVLKTATYGEIWRPIGWGDFTKTVPPTTTYCPFEGIFDGNGHTISGLAEESLFGNAIGATIKNLSTSGELHTLSLTRAHSIAGIVNAAIHTDLLNLTSDVALFYEASSPFCLVGGIVGNAIGTMKISDCKFEGSYDKIGTNQPNVPGGIVGQVGFSVAAYDTDLTIENCVNEVDLVGSTGVGGIAGGVYYSAGSSNSTVGVKLTIKNCVNNGDMSSLIGGATYIGTGGILGNVGWMVNVDWANNVRVTIDNCVNTGNISGFRSNVGGIVGYLQYGNGSSIKNSYNWGNVSVGSPNHITPALAAGGIAGRVDNAAQDIFENNYNAGVVSSDQPGAPYVGGFIGYASGTSVIAGASALSANNYYLDTSAPGAVASEDYTGVTAETEEYMKSAAFAEDLGSAYAAVEDSYPFLSWQIEETPVDEPINEHEPVDTDVPPEGPDTTVVTVKKTVQDSDSQGDVWSLTIKKQNGESIESGVKFYVWFIAFKFESDSIHSAAETRYGPFVTTSAANANGDVTLTVDVDALETPEGTKASISAGTYQIKYADEDTRGIIGTTGLITTRGTSAPISGGGETNGGGTRGSNSSGGGCDASGFGSFALLAAAGSVFLRGKRIRTTERSDLNKAA